jgi:hypothetical protein
LPDGILLLEAIRDHGSPGLLAMVSPQTSVKVVGGYP